MIMHILLPRKLLPKITYSKQTVAIIVSYSWHA